MLVTDNNHISCKIRKRVDQILRSGTAQIHASRLNIKVFFLLLCSLQQQKQQQPTSYQQIANNQPTNQPTHQASIHTSPLVMFNPNNWSLALASVLSFSSFIHTVHSTLALCATDNTGISSTNLLSDYQSNGLCADTCSGYTYAIVLYKGCWCSNTAPSDTIDLSKCDVDCPGYPYEFCGDETNNYYGYIQLKQVSSTTTAATAAATAATSTSATATTTTTSSTSSTTSSRSGTTTVTLASTTSTSKQVTSTTTTSSTPSSTSSTSPQTTTTTTTPSSSTGTSQTTSTTTSAHIIISTVPPVTSYIYSLMTITGSQQVAITTTEVISTSISEPTTTAVKDTSRTNKSFFQSPGKVAGTFTAVGIVVLAIIATLIYCLFFAAGRRHRNGDAYIEEDNGSSNIASPDNEKIIGGTTPPLPFVPPITVTQAPVRPGVPRLSTNSLDDDYIEVDQRLDPRQMFMNWENGSRKSLNDNTDYSRRVLRVTNDD